MQLDMRPLGSSALCVSRIGLGCVTFGREIDESTARAILDHAVARDITLLDTAAVYGEGASETILGRWMRDRAVRDRIVLATKVSGRLARDRIVQSAEDSLRRLQTDRVDLLQAHDWDGETPLQETTEAFQSLIDRGLIRAWGCSNWNAEQLLSAVKLTKESHGHQPASIQPIYNLVDRRIEETLLEVCNAEAIGVISYSPLGAGFLTGKYGRDGIAPEGTRFDIKPAHRDIYFTDHGFQVVESLRAIAEQADHSMPQLALAWVFRQTSLTSVLIGARTPRHVNQAFEALRLAATPELQPILKQLFHNSTHANDHPTR